jgi:hypothetical protein
MTRKGRGREGQVEKKGNWKGWGMGKSRKKENVEKSRTGCGKGKGRGNLMGKRSRKVRGRKAAERVKGGRKKKSLFSFL